MSKLQWQYIDLGLSAYKAVWDYQESLHEKKISQKIRLTKHPDASETPEPDYLIFTEHNPVYTLGKNGKESNVLISAEERKQKQIEFYHINRGGDITFHGPGQIVGYPILDLERIKTDIGWYLRSLEEVIIRTLHEYGISAGRSKGETGVWIDADIKGKERKICAMGIRISRWITLHGFALNVNTDLDYFKHIIPCGIQDKQVTSIQKELGHFVDMQKVKLKLLKQFAAVFDIEISDEITQYRYEQNNNSIIASI